MLTDWSPLVVLQVFFLGDIFALVHEDKLVSARHEDDGEHANAEKPVVARAAEKKGDDGDHAWVENDIAHFENGFVCTS